MSRGTFANIRLVNKFMKKAGPQTVYHPTGESVSINDNLHVHVCRKINCAEKYFDASQIANFRKLIPTWYLMPLYKLNFMNIEVFYYAPGLKGSPGASSVWIVNP